MPQITSRWLSERIGLIDVLGYGYDGTIASYVLRGSRSSALVDVGHAANARNVLRGLSELGVSADSIRYIFVTHHHLDHMGAAARLLNDLPNAEIVAGEESIRHLVEPSRLLAATYETFGDAYREHIGAPPAAQPERIRPLKEDYRYDLGGISVKPVLTPGHTASHTSYYVEELSAIFTGDSVCVTRPGIPLLLPAASPPMIDVDASLASLDKVRSYKPKMLFMPHFGYVDYSDDFIERNKEALMWFQDRISGMFASGMGSEQITSEIRKELMEGLKGYSLDEATRSLLLDTMLRISVMGFLGSLMRKRRR